MSTLSLFEGYGIEIESMLVDAETLDVRPLVDEVLREAGGGAEWVEDFDDGPIGWSNELVTHVVEFKTNGPAPSYAGLAEAFRASQAHFGRLLQPRGARLMPTGMHPWMDPRRETRIWPHEHGPVYSAYDRLFDCRRHGWANLQSVHLNLPFADEREFERLMAAARIVLPLIPALAASSPVVEGRATGRLDNRLEHYATNAARVPLMAGSIVPEPIFDPTVYREQVLGGLDRQLGEVGADAALRGQEWTNARGAIARFDRMAIEIRLIDAQECAAADLAVAAAVTGLVRGLVEERWAPLAVQREQSTESLRGLLDRTAAEGPRARATRAYAGLFGVAGECDFGALWQRLAPDAFAGPLELEPHLERILAHGTLAERILSSLGADFDRARLRAVYGRLCDCLADGVGFSS